MVKKKMIFTAAFMAFMAIPATSKALTLESKALIEEIRGRLQRTHAPATIKELSEEKYIPGQELKNALSRLRRNLYPEEPRDGKTFSQMRPSFAFKEESEKDFTVNEYIPGSQLAASLEKIRTRREIIRMIKLIQATKAANHIPQITTAYSAPVSEKTSQDDPVGQTSGHSEQEAPVEKVVAAEPERKNSAQLLKAAGLKLDRNLVHESKGQVPAQVEPEKAVIRRRNEDEDQELNNELSKFEFKMPSNYRIRVQ